MSEPIIPDPQPAAQPAAGQTVSHAEVPDAVKAHLAAPLPQHTIATADQILMAWKYNYVPAWFTDAERLTVDFLKRP